MKESNNIAGAGVPALDGAYMINSGKCTNSISITNIIIGVAIVAVGVLIMFMQQQGMVTDKNFSSAVSMAGLLMSIYGIYFAIAKKRTMVCQQTGCPMRHYQIYFDADQLPTVKAFVKGVGESLPQSKTQGNVKLNAFIAKDGTMACVQLSTFHDLIYEPVDAPMFTTEVVAQELNEYMKKNK